MKQTLLITLFSFALTSFVIASTDTITDTITDKMAVVGSPGLSSDPCAAIDEKVMRLDRFAEVVKNTSAFHLEEKANAISTPGITVSNNRKKMLRDADKKYAEYTAERQKYGCETPMTTSTSQIAEKMAVISKSSLSSEPSPVREKKPIKSDETTTKVSNTTAVHAEKKAAAVPVAKTTVSDNKEEMAAVAEKKDVEPSPVRQTSNVEAPITASTTQVDDKITASDNATFSSEKCNTLDEELIELSVFTTMVKNTSAFHLEEKARALPSPGFTVSNNKKKMLRDIEKRYSELLKEHKKYGCEPL